MIVIMAFVASGCSLRRCLFGVFLRPYLFVDLETRQKVKVQPSEVKEFYKKEVKKYYLGDQMVLTQTKQLKGTGRLEPSE